MGRKFKFVSDVATRIVSKKCYSQNKMDTRNYELSIRMSVNTMCSVFPELSNKHWQETLYSEGTEKPVVAS